MGWRSAVQILKFTLLGGLAGFLGGAVYTVLSGGFGEFDPQVLRAVFAGAIFGALYKPGAGVEPDSEEADR